MSLSAIRTQIKTIIAGVSGIGKVYDYVRNEREPQDFKTLYVDSNDYINAWMITRQNTATTLKSTGPDAVNLQKHLFSIYGFYSIVDGSATEKTFQDLIESVCAALNAKYNLNSTCLVHELCQVKSVKTAKLGNYPVHTCQIDIAVTEYVTYTMS